MSTRREERRARWQWLRSGKWEQYAWLVYSIPYLAAAFDPRFSPLQTWAMVAAYALFLVLYFRSIDVRGTRAWLAIAGHDLLALALSPWNPGAGVFLIYGSSRLSNIRPFTLAVLGLLVQVLIGIGLAAWLKAPAWYWITTSVVSALVGGVCIQAAVNADRDAKLRLAQDEVERLAKLAERERIARDLHDLLGHTLSVIVLKSELAQKLMARDQDGARREMAEVERTARSGLADVRNAITGYRSSGLIAEFDQVRDALASAGITTTIDVGTVTLEPMQETALSLVLREAVTNVIRHAGATECRIRFYAQDRSVLMEVADNGRGGNAPFGNGLAGMRERVQALGGQLLRDSTRGTRLEIRLPLGWRQQAKAPVSSASTA